MMKLLAVLMSTVLLPLSSAVTALQAETFSEERFRELQREDALILVDIYADWCPTCEKQHELLEEYQSQRGQDSLHILKVNFDEEKEWVGHFNAPRQSTLILFRGEEQVWFSVAETDRERLFAKLDEGGEAL